MPKMENGQGAGAGILKKDLAKRFNDFLFITTPVDLYHHLIVI